MSDSTPHLPTRVRAAWDAAGLGEIDRATPIKHGLTNDSWLVHQRPETFVVRFSNADTQTLQIDRRSEERILRATAAAGVGAPVVACEPHWRLLVTRYVGAAWSLEAMHERVGMAAIVQLLRRVHAVMPPAATERVDLLAAARGYVSVLLQHGVHPTLASDARIDRAAGLNAALRSNAMCLCHNDVHHLNVVGVIPVLIDWEYAGVGEPFVDLASVCVYHAFTPAQRRELLALYLRQTDAGAEHRLEAACWLFDYVRELWLSVRALPAGER